MGATESTPPVPAFKSPLIKQERAPPQVVEQKEQKLIPVIPYQFKQKAYHTLFGDLILVQDLINNRTLSLIETFFSTKHELKSQITLVTYIKSLKHPNLLEIDFLQSNEDAVFANMHKLSHIFEYHDLDLHTDLKWKKIHSKEFYFEEEVIDFLEQVVPPLAFLQSKGITHGCVNPYSILIDQTHKKKVYKLLPPCGLKGQDNFQQVLNLGSMAKEIFLSPKQISLIKEKKPIGGQFPANGYKSDVWSLGCIVLSMLRNSWCDGFFDYIKFELESESIVLALKNIKEIVKAPFLGSLLDWMLEIDEKRRCDFIELEKVLKGALVNMRREIIEQQKQKMESCSNNDGENKKSFVSVPEQGTIRIGLKLNEQNKENEQKKSFIQTLANKEEKNMSIQPIKPPKENLVPFNSCLKENTPKIENTSEFDQATRTEFSLPLQKPSVFLMPLREKSPFNPQDNTQKSPISSTNPSFQMQMLTTQENLPLKKSTPKSAQKIAQFVVKSPINDKSEPPSRNEPPSLSYLPSKTTISPNDSQVIEAGSFLSPQVLQIIKDLQHQKKPSTFSSTTSIPSSQKLMACEKSNERSELEVEKAAGSFIQGKWRFKFPDGSLYEGDYKDGAINGFGTLFYPNKCLAYMGLWRNGKFHGRGSCYNNTPGYLQEFDGKNFDLIGSGWNKYEGEFVNGRREGKGMLYLMNGAVFEGEFLNDIINGKGCFKAEEGRCLIGEWTNGVFQERQF